MLALAFSAAIAGIDAHVARVETDSAAGIPIFTLVGLADLALNQSRERVRAAIVNSGFGFPPARLLVNLAPADMRGSIQYRSRSRKLNSLRPELNTVSDDPGRGPRRLTTVGLADLKDCPARSMTYFGMGERRHAEASRWL